MVAKVIGFIPARKGSTRFPNKNRASYRGKELWQVAVETALHCLFIDEVILSTDDEAIIEKALEYPINVYKRPEHLATDTAEVWDAVAHHLKGYNPATVIILLQPTSPQRTEIDVFRAWTLYRTFNCPVLSACETDDNHYFYKNGAIYITELGWGSFVPHRYDRHMPRLYLMPKERSIDIDYLKDLEELNERDGIMLHEGRFSSR